MLVFSSTFVRDFTYLKPIIVETSISEKGIPTFEIFGLINKSIEESKKRIITAFESVGIIFPLKNIKVNLAPSEISKEGTHFDLAIAVSLLSYTSSFNYDLNKDLFLGELSFNGDLRKIDSCMYFVLLGIENGYKRIFIPHDNLGDIKINTEVEILGIKNILDLINGNFYKNDSRNDTLNVKLDGLTFNSIIGNELGKKVISYSISGKHHIALEGFPGSGKSLLIKSVIDLLPPLTDSELLKIIKIYSYCGLDRVTHSFNSAPFRSPHSSSSYSSIFGTSGKNIYPGEVALSNKGVLFLDELPEFNRQVIEGMRGPLEDKRIQISRSSKKISFETDFILMATLNPCKCGYFNHYSKPCKCSPSEIIRYRNRISGPIWDRIDILLNMNDKINIDSHFEQNNYSYKKYIELKEKIALVRDGLNSILSIDKSINLPDINKSTKLIQKCLSSKTTNLLNSVQENYSLSNRSLLKILKLSLTVSLFKNNSYIQEEDFLEAVSLIKKE